MAASSLNRDVVRAIQRTVAAAWPDLDSAALRVLLYCLAVTSVRPLWGIIRRRPTLPATTAPGLASVNQDYAGTATVLFFLPLFVLF